MKSTREICIADGRTAEDGEDCHRSSDIIFQATSAPFTHTDINDRPCFRHKFVFVVNACKLLLSLHPSRPMRMANTFGPYITSLHIRVTLPNRLLILVHNPFGCVFCFERCGVKVNAVLTEIDRKHSFCCSVHN